MANIAEELAREVKAATAELAVISELDARKPPAPGKWSIAEILGHLIDSAANNHQRFIRCQQLAPGEMLVLPGYQQDPWVERNGYAEAPWPEIVQLWRLYNLQLVRVMERIPEPRLASMAQIGGDEPVTLGFLTEDYVDHLRHHLAQIRTLARKAS